MTDEQWQNLLAVIRGEELAELPTGFIIDSPWLPNWAGQSILDFYTRGDVWFEAHARAHATFETSWFIPGFWSEYGMCTEPSAFGAVCSWTENDFPFAKRIIHTLDDIDRIEKPDCRKDGLLPFVIQRLRQYEPEIAKTGRKIRFAIARGPLNVASFLMGTTEFLTALKTDADRMQQLLGIVTDFLVEWIAYQRECFPTIDGLLVLDDLVGFVGKADFLKFAQGPLKRIFSADVSVRLFHNDAPCKVAAPFLSGVGINMLNFGVQHTLAEMKAWTEDQITLLGNVPPRDVLAQGTPADVERAVREMVEGLPNRRRLVVSCGGGMPPGAPTDNIRALIAATKALGR
jgi:uroporphyrinogen-III decarboxylase